MKSGKNEKNRLRALRSYEVLDTPAELDLDQLTQLAAAICDVPMALISLVDEKRQWFKSKVGLDLKETPIEISFCAHAIQRADVMIVKDATTDERFMKNPLVTAENGVRFYAGAPLISPTGQALGTICVLDRQPKALLPHQVNTLELLAKQIVKHFELRKVNGKLRKQRVQLNATRARLNETAQLLLKIMNNLPVAFACKNMSDGGRYNLWNKKASDFWGVSRERALGKTDQQLFEKGRADILQTKAQETLTNLRESEIEEEIASAETGSKLTISTRQIPVVFGNGKSKFVLVLSEDITLKKKAQDQFVDSSRMASLAQMAAGVAHEINNPLAIIRGKTFQLNSQLKKGGSPDEMRKIIEKIDETTVRISKIINGLRDFTREGNSTPLQKSSVREIVEAATELCAPKLESSGVTLAVPTENFDVVLDCGQVQLAQVLLNLLNNAIDASVVSTEKSVQIEILDQGQNIEIAVLDSGAGVPENIRRNIMQPFFTTKEVGQGTGLGLSISKGIVEAHGGTLWLDEKSKRTRFAFRIPKNATGAGTRRYLSSAA